MSTVGRALVFCATLVVFALLLYVLASFAEAAVYIGYLVREATVLQIASVLWVLVALSSVAAIAVAGVSLHRRRLVPALAALVVPLSVTLLIGSLPAKMQDWSVRLRPVSEADEAEQIASAALWEAGLETHPFRAKSFEGHWIVSATDGDGRAGAAAVRIETDTGNTSLIPCPAGKIQCGWELPTLADGQRVFRNRGLGIAATFSTASPVCTARDTDGDPLGFFTIARSSDVPCEVLDPSRTMGLEIVRAPKGDCRSRITKIAPWGDLQDETMRMFERTPTLGEGRSIACELRMAGQVQISVFAEVGFPKGARRLTHYEAYLVTTPADLTRDVPKFEAFLAKVRIGAPA